MAVVKVFSKMGPGLLFAGAAIGVSHIVQSTRAGAVYGLWMIPVVILVLCLKYPAFAFGPQYAQATGKSLLHGYQERSRWHLALFILAMILPFFIVVASVTLVTAGLAGAAFGLEFPVLWIAIAVLFASILLLQTGGYRLMDRMMKWVVAFITLSTFVATFVALHNLELSGLTWSSTEFLQVQTLFFVVALLGFMPAPVDLSVMHSLWTVEKQKHTTISGTDAWWDFNVGYLGCGLLALCFILLGASLMYPSGVRFENSAVGFAQQVIQMYSQSLGPYMGFLVGISAFLILFSTTLTVLDGFSRVVAESAALLSVRFTTISLHGWNYSRALWAFGIGAITILAVFQVSIKGLVDFATSVTFVLSPFVAYLNHDVMFSGALDPVHVPSRGMKLLSLLGTIVLGAVVVVFFWVKWFYVSG
ncbi:MAG: divalent metal cation transporter [Zetaproteobacteria bacterium]|nr:divalent metal cation transporter [Zetaproteobacteria bacterium]